MGKDWLAYLLEILHVHLSEAHICAFDTEIQKLVLNGRIGEAIGTTQRLYPGLLERNRDLLFMLKCRQFIEMVNGTDDVGVSKSSANNPLFDVTVSPPGSSSSSPPAFASPNSSPTHPPSSSSVSQTVTGYQYQQQQDTSSGHVILPKNSHSSNGLASDPPRQSLFSEEEEEEEEDRLNSTNLAMNGSGRLDALHIATDRQSIDSEDEMDITEMEDVCVVNGTSNGTCRNGQTHFDGRSPTYGKGNFKSFNDILCTTVFLVLFTYHAKLHFVFLLNKML